MKIIHILSAATLLGTTASVIYAQSRSINGNGFDNTDVNADAREGVKETTKRVVTIEYIAVSPERTWKSADEGKDPITGTLLAFHREKGTGKLSIIQDEQVRLLVGKRDFTLPLGKLSEEDQDYISEIVATARAAGKLVESSESVDEAASP